MSKSVHHQDEQQQATTHQSEAQNLGRKRHRLRWRVDQVFRQLPTRHETIVLYEVLALEFFERHLAGEHEDIKRELVRPPVIIKEVHGEQEPGGQHRFLAVEDGGEVEHPAGQIRSCQTLHPQHCAAAADDGNAPERRPVVELLPVGPAVELRLRRQTEEPLEHADGIVEVRQVGNHRIGSEPAEGLPVTPNAQKYVGDVPAEYPDEAGGEEAMHIAGDARAAEYVTDDRRPRSVGK